MNRFKILATTFIITLVGWLEYIFFLVPNPTGFTMIVWALGLLLNLILLVVIAAVIIFVLGSWVYWAYKHSEYETYEEYIKRKW